MPQDVPPGNTDRHEVRQPEQQITPDNGLRTYEAKGKDGANPGQ